MCVCLGYKIKEQIADTGSLHLLIWLHYRFLVKKEVTHTTYIEDTMHRLADNANYRYPEFFRAKDE